MQKGQGPVTVMVPLVPVTPPTVALTVALPGPTPVITPLLFTVRTLGLLLVQLVASPVASRLACAGLRKRDQ